LKKLKDIQDEIGVLKDQLYDPDPSAPSPEELRQMIAELEALADTIRKEIEIGLGICDG
jgi:hypothetical protein